VIRRHTPRFGDVVRQAVHGTSIIVFDTATIRLEDLRP
jgi:hypothetical protein